MEVELDLGDGPKRYTRETNVMPQWAGSCWYELRYLDPANSDRFVDPANERYWMGPQAPGDCGGIDLYVGGAEHAVLHLLYARFWHKVLYDLGHVSSFEPFRKLFNQGMIQAYAYVDDRDRYVEAAEVVEREGGWFHGEQPVAARVRKDGQVTAERGDAGRDVRGVRRGHLPGLRDVDGAAGGVPALGDPGGSRVVPVPAAGVAGAGRRADRRAAGGRHAGG